MKSISVIAAVAIAVRHADANVKPAILTTLGPNTGCKTDIDTAMLRDECGYSLDKPCIVTRKKDPVADAALCNKKYMVARTISGGFPNTIYVQAAELDNTITEEFHFHQKAWQGICPYQCKPSQVCKILPSECANNTVYEDIVAGGAYVIPGSARVEPTEAVTIQWTSYDASGNRDGADNSAEIDLVDGPFSYELIYGRPTRMANSTDYCDGLTEPMSLADVMNTACGGTGQVPCPAAVSGQACGKCYNVTIFTDGLMDDTITQPPTAICANSTCPATVTHKIFRKVADTVSSGAGFGRAFQPGMGLWTQPDVCPYLCTNPATAASVCVSQQSDCKATLATNTTVPAADGWAEYVEPGSMKADRFTFFVGPEVVCPTAANSAVGRTAGGFAMSLFVLAAMVASM